jgi:DNA-binding beta-propeller fold protein YncE
MYMTIRSVICLGLGAISLAACSLGSSGSPLAGPTVPYSGRHSQVRNAIAPVMIPGDSCCTVAIDHSLKQIYVSSAVNLSGNNTTVVDAKTFSVVASVSGYGGAQNVDSQTDNVWLAGLYSGDVEVYSGSTLSPITTVSLGFCPIGSRVDSTRRYAWISAQCGSDTDPVWVLNADTYAIVAGPIRTGGVMNPVNSVNPVTGRFYGNNSSGNFEINPHTFKLSPISFGYVQDVDETTNLIYASITDGLNIVGGNSEKIKKTVALSYTPSFVCVDEAQNHIYIGSGNNVIEVREGNTGRLLGKVKLPSGVTLGANSVRADYVGSGPGLIYAVGATSSGDYLYKRTDNF